MEEGLLTVQGQPGDATVPIPPSPHGSGDGSEGRERALFALFSCMFAACLGLCLALVGDLVSPGAVLGDGRGGAVVAMYAVFAATFVAGQALFFRRLQFQPLRARSPLLLFVSSVAGFLVVSWGALSAHQGGRLRLGCEGSRAVVIVGYPAFILPYYLRAYRLSRVFWRNQAIVAHAAPARTRPVTQGGLFRVLLVLLAPFFAVAVASLWFRRSLFPVCPRDAAPHDFLAFWATIHAVETACFLGAVLLLRRVWDSYSIRSEMVAAAALTLACSAAGLALGGRSRESVAADAAKLAGVRVAAFFALSVLWPTYRTHFRPPDDEFLSVPRREALGALADALEDPLCFRAFQKFCVRELCSDLLAFWAEAQIYRMDGGGAAEARRVWEEYVAAERVWLPAAIRARVEESLAAGGGEPGLYDEAQRRVLDALEAESYPRFLQSELCGELVRELDRQEEVAKAVARSDLA